VKAPRYPRDARNPLNIATKHPAHQERQGDQDALNSREKGLRISGLPAVSALFTHAPDRALRLFYDDRMVNEVGHFCSQMAEMRRPYRKLDPAELTKIAGTVLHGGIVAVARPKAVLPFNACQTRQWAVDREPLVILDGIGNTHNLGAIARTLAFFGFRRLLISDHPEQCGLSDSAYRVAEGGLEALTVYRVKALPEALRLIKPHYRVVGTALTRQGLMLDAVLEERRPVALVLGNEEAGLPRATLAACDALLTLPGSGNVQSLNVSATAAIIAYALRPPQTVSKTRRPAQKRKDGDR
jgi:TrmH RNA methyltransferase